MAVEFDTTEFTNSHGRPPRGRGSWGFQFRVNGDWVADPSQDIGWGDLALCWWATAPLSGGQVATSLTFGEAKQWARAKARELGADLVKVCA